MNNNVILIVVLSPLIIMYAGGDYMLGCYYDHYATQRHEKGKDTLRNYVPGLCTHIIFAYAGMDDLFNIEHVNFVEVRTIDMHGFWEPFTGFNSPLYDRNGDHLSISTAANYWTSKGMPKNKIMLSLATFGRSFVLVKPENHGVGAGSTTDPNPGRYTKSEGLLSFFEICEYLESDTAVCYDDKQQGVPYAINGNKWVGYDNTYSLAAKVEWLKHNKFGGVIVFSLDLDDYIGLCGWSKGEKYPLIRTLHTSLYGNSSVALNQKLKEPKCCPGDGLHPDTTNCRNYYYNCRLLSCGDCLVFNSDRNICDFPERYSCKNPDTNV
uniref:GH18 domain-containing protein n=1 Tax=Romanomermis culicivorax TaxID=13658 RepID=A0A915L7E0_ROMCU